MTVVVVGLVALLTSLALTALLVRWAPRLGLVDQPSARKVHTRPTPKGGGLALFASLAVATGLQSIIHFPCPLSHSSLILLGLGFLIVVLGLLDDIFNLPWQLRLSVQLAVAAAAVVWVVPYSVLGATVAVFWIVALVNAFNMLDNMDALSAGVAWIAAGTFASVLLPRGGDGLPYVLLLGALTGFLWFNRPPARLFMGDAGSTFLGFFLGVRSLSDGFINPDEPHTWLVPLCVLAVPLYDQATVVALRLWQGHSPFHADKQHLSHRLVALGLRPPAAVGVIYLLALGSGAAGLAVASVSEGVAWWIGGGLAAAWTVVAYVEYAPRFRGKV